MLNPMNNYSKNKKILYKPKSENKKISKESMIKNNKKNSLKSKRNTQSQLPTETKLINLSNDLYICFLFVLNFI